jgi:hypothetical protein
MFHYVARNNTQINHISNCLIARGGVATVRYEPFVISGSLKPSRAVSETVFSDFVVRQPLICTFCARAGSSTKQSWQVTGKNIMHFHPSTPLSTHSKTLNSCNTKNYVCIELSSTFFFYAIRTHMHIIMI